MHFSTSNTERGSMRSSRIVTNRRREKRTSIYATFVRYLARHCRNVSERERTCIFFHKNANYTVVTGSYHDDVAVFPPERPRVQQLEYQQLARIYVTAIFSRVEKRMIEEIKKERWIDVKKYLCIIHHVYIYRNYTYIARI